MSGRTPKERTFYIWIRWNNKYINDLKKNLIILYLDLYKKKVRNFLFLTVAHYIILNIININDFYHSENIILFGIVKNLKNINQQKIELLAGR